MRTLGPEERRQLLERARSLHKINHYRPFGHPDTLCPRGKVKAGKLWKNEGWSMWTNKPWQLEFHNMGATKDERILIAGNRVGKSQCGAAEMTYHLTGLYPDWWEGRVFDHPVDAWACSITNENSRDIVQKALIGGFDELLGTGFIPFDRIIGTPTKRACGVPDVADMVRVRHVSGGISTLGFKSYEMGYRKFQGTKKHVVWLDEEPDPKIERERLIFSECQMRITDARGILLVTFTPLQGKTELVEHFERVTARTYMVTATWDDAPHLDESRKSEMLENIPEYMREARTRGIPMLGEGRALKFMRAAHMRPAFPIPRHFHRIKGVDFGIDHPFACVDGSIDRDKDIIYITREYRASNQHTAVNAEAVKGEDPMTPVAWPHDGGHRQQGSGITLARQYLSHKVNMLAWSARYDDEKGGAQSVEPIVLEVNDRLETGRLIIFECCPLLADEMERLHRKNGQIVAVADDLFKAMCYLIMMHRHAQPLQVPVMHGASPYTRPLY